MKQFECIVVDITGNEYARWYVTALNAESASRHVTGRVDNHINKYGDLSRETGEYPSLYGIVINEIES